MVYLDVVLIYSKTIEQHAAHVSSVLAALQQAKFQVRLSKCSFAQTSTKFLGYLISANGISTDPDKITALSKWSFPKDLTAMRSFLGFTGFYRRFVRNYAQIAGPLTALTKTTVPYPASPPPAALAAFSALKAALTSAPVLVPAKMGTDATFSLYVDASLDGIGAVLMQEHNNALHPIAFESRTLAPAERGYTVPDLECLAIVHGLKKFRAYLEGCAHFDLYTDHRNLTSFLTQKDLTRRQVPWAQLISSYQPNMTIKHIDGKKNVADALSRYPINPITLASLFTPSLSSPEPSLSSLSSSSLDPSSDLHSSIKASYSADPLYASSAKRPPFLTLSPDGFWRVSSRIAVPKSPALFTRILHELHDATYSGHPGYTRTLNAVAAAFWWPHMSKTIRKYVASCPTCQATKPSTLPPPGLLQPHSVPSRPWSHVSLDHITDLPPSPSPDGSTYDSIATFVDMFSKQAHFAPCNKTISAPQLATLFLSNVYRLHGLPSTLVSDRDPRFTSTFWSSLWHHLGTKLNISTAYHPQTDGQTERTHRTIEQILRAYVHPHHDDWVTFLPIAESAYNAATNASTNASPFLVNYGFQPTTPATLHLPQALPNAFNSDAAPIISRLQEIHQRTAQELELARERAASQANRHRRELTFAVGDMVRLSTQHLVLGSQPSAKLRDRFVGPFPIEAVISPVAYRLTLPPSFSRVHPVFHVSRLLPWTSSDPTDFPDRAATPRPPLAARDYVSGDDTFLVDSILQVKLAKDQHASGQPTVLQFLVRWAPPYSDPAHDTWEPLRHVQRLDALKDFLCSPEWFRFKASAAFERFAKKWPRRVPKVVTVVP